MTSLRAAALGGTGAVIVALVGVITVAVPQGDPGSLPRGDAQTTAPTAPFPFDDRGFVNSPARCDGAQTAVAIGRTNRSLLAICTDASGSDQYRGVRISDGATLTLAAKPTDDGRFVGQNDDITYTVSAKELLVTSGDTVVNREPMVAYQQPRFSAEATPTAHPAR